MLNIKNRGMKSAARYLIVVFFSLFAVNNLPAQDSIKALPPVIVTATTTKVSAKVWKGFSSYFNTAEMPIRWYRLNKDYLVKFMIYDEQNRALFSKKGKLIYHISYGYEKSLPDNVREQVKGSYANYEITRAIKVTEASREIWVVNLEDTNTIILVRIENDEMEEVQTIQKSS